MIYSINILLLKKILFYNITNTGYLLLIKINIINNDLKIFYLNPWSLSLKLVILPSKIHPIYDNINNR